MVGHVLHGKSPCAFSGQEDLDASPLRTQTPHEVWLGPAIGVVNPAPEPGHRLQSQHGNRKNRLSLEDQLDPEQTVQSGRA